jgi:uncharacterized protein YxeA
MIIWTDSFCLSYKLFIIKQIIMKKILFAVVLMITSFSAFSQQKKVLNNQFSDYVQFQKAQQKRPQVRPHQFPMRPKPLSVTFRRDKVIVVFRKQDYLKLRPIVRERMIWRERPRGAFQQRLLDKMEH